MESLQDFWTWLKASGDAEDGLNLQNERFVSRNGDRPVISPATNLADGQIADKIRASSDKKEHSEDQDELEQERSRYGSLIINLLGIVFCVLLEIVGANLVVKSLGYDNPERLAYGLGLAALIFISTHYAFSFKLSKDASRGQTIMSCLTWFIFIIIYIVVVIAVAFVRRVDGSGWAETVIITAATIGPAWMVSTTLWPRYERSRSIRQKLRLNSKKIKNAERDERTVNDYVAHTAREQAKWDKARAKHTARYSATHQRISARRKT